MADWYVSSATYASVAAFVASTAYSVGNLVKPTAPAFAAQYVFRCTTAGTSGTEPAWPAANNATITTGGVTFTNVSGQSAYGWSAAAGALAALAITINGRPVTGDRVFLSSDHSESTSAAVNYNFNSGTAAFGLVQIISVNRAGSVPPVEADIANGAALTMTVSTSAALALEAYCNLFWQGITFSVTASTSTAAFTFNATGRKSHYLKNCAIVLSSTSAAAHITTQGVAKVTLDNTTIQFGNVAQAINNNAPLDFNWINTPSAIQGATIPTALFTCGTAAPPLYVTCRGVDLSAITGTLCQPTTGTSGGSMKALFDSCKIASGVVRLAAPATISNAGDDVELVNCYDGTNTINERWSHPGSLAMDRSTYLSSGAQDDIGAYSLRLTSNVRADKNTLPLQCFAFDVENTVVGSSKTATVEVAGPNSLNNDDISLLLEYMGTSSSSVASFVSSLPATVLTAGSALSSSSSTWATTPTYTTWNPLDLANATLSNNNLTATSTGIGGARGVVGFATGKYYFEYTVTTWAQTGTAVGAALASAAFGSSALGAALVAKTGSIIVNGVSSGSVIGARASGDIIGIAVDLGANLIWFRVAPSGSWNATSGTANNPATGVGGVSISSISGTLFPWFFGNAASEAATANFGASAFSGTVPSGFSAGWFGAPTSTQHIQVSFTPQVAGRVRGSVRLGKASTMVWVNPQMTVT